MAMTKVEKEDRIIRRALNIIEGRVKTVGVRIGGAGDAKAYFSLTLGAAEQEQFHVMLLNAQSQVITSEAVGLGTVTECRVHPREVVKAAMRHNAASIIVCHNHPSGSVMPSEADKKVTKDIKAACDLMSIRLLDHIIVSNLTTFSFAESGIL